MKPIVATLIAACLIAAPIHTALAADAAGPKLESNKNRTALDAMHGQPAPELAVKDWINSKPVKLAT